MAGRLRRTRLPCPPAQVWTTPMGAAHRDTNDPERGAGEESWAPGTQPDRRAEGGAWMRSREETRQTGQKPGSPAGQHTDGRGPQRSNSPANCPLPGVPSLGPQFSRASPPCFPAEPGPRQDTPQAARAGAARGVLRCGRGLLRDGARREPFRVSGPQDGLLTACSSLVG